ncbi:hypothetical protein D770_22995 [Flammeovirgaceae bacterium 311]|nr:hypothetical protein D770_22995 [Flammeovirgaceae bacterium 311]
MPAAGLLSLTLQQQIISGKNKSSPYKGGQHTSRKGSGDFRSPFRFLSFYSEESEGDSKNQFF